VAVPDQIKEPVSFSTSLAGLFLFFFCQLILIPFAATALAPLLSSLVTIPMQQSLLQFFAAGGLAIFMSIYAYYKRQECKNWWNSDHFLRQVGKGIALFFVAYPLVLVVSASIASLLYWLGWEEIKTQAAVLSLERIKEHPSSFAVLAASIIFWVPFVEEIAFRGFLLSFFLKITSPKIAIAVTSLLFGVFHYSPMQGMSNITIIVSLALLGIFLAALKIKQGTLIAPISLHMTFNLFNILLIFWKEQ
jgi:membrane protease YdiL (CAAX protease family)